MRVRKPRVTLSQHVIYSFAYVDTGLVSVKHAE